MIKLQYLIGQSDATQDIYNQQYNRKFCSEHDLIVTEVN